MLYKAAAQGARKGKRRVGAPENTANPLNAAIAQLVEHLIRNDYLALLRCAALLLIASAAP